MATQKTNAEKPVEMIATEVLKNAGFVDPSSPTSLQKALSKRHEGKLNRESKNLSTLRSPAFEQACKEAGVPATPRQASKWNNGYGAAYRTKFVS